MRLSACAFAAHKQSHRCSTHGPGSQQPLEGVPSNVLLFRKIPTAMDGISIGAAGMFSSDDTMSVADADSVSAGFKKSSYLHDGCQSREPSAETGA